MPAELAKRVIYSFWEHFSVKLEYPGKIQTPEFFRNLQSFAKCSMKMSIRYNFFNDLDSTHNKLSSDYSLNICFY